jgi:cell division protein FtsL
MMTKSRARRFLVTWFFAVLATVCAFIVHLALRGKTISLGYELGKARVEQARLREVKRVLDLEAASYKTPERVEVVARSLWGMESAGPDRTIVISAPAPVAPAAPEVHTANSPDGGAVLAQGRAP